jgi:hypothetical protein
MKATSMLMFEGAPEIALAQLKCFDLHASFSNSASIATPTPGQI